ncbi:MAG TPA: RagB/SusD family nutrient uptake outer membrane protein [Flavobacterium sp.]|nr:RagB/SusD family nutrient uptake outer membrane protein [Flavobacterium sp.]
MKNIKKVIFFVSTICFFASCDDLTTIEQPGQLTEEQTFQTIEDLERGLSGVYDAMSATPTISFNSIFTDEVRPGFSNTNPATALYQFDMFTTSGYVYSIWQNNLSVINFANRIIRSADNVPATTPAEIAIKNDIIASCHILRAYSHFQLLTYFSEDLTNDSALGCQKVDFVPTIYQQVPRSTNGEVFALIESDLAYADQLIDVVDNPEKVFYVSPDMVKALRARIALYREDYATALTLADELIAKYPLTIRKKSTDTSVPNPNSTDYFRLWRDNVANPDENIFKLRRAFPQDESIGNIWAVNNATLSGFSNWGMSTDLYEMIYDPSVSYNRQNDIRANVCISNTSKFQDGFIVLQKYTGGSQNPLQQDYKVFRSSEMYFIKAEAVLATTGDLNQVKSILEAVNDVRLFNPNLKPIPTLSDAKAAWAQILTERRKELCYEGHRWVDLKRLGKKAQVGVERNPADCNGNCTLPYDSYKFTMPIPQREIDANESIRSQQNSGY